MDIAAFSLSLGLILTGIASKIIYVNRWAPDHYDELLAPLVRKSREKPISTQRVLALALLVICWSSALVLICLQREQTGLWAAAIALECFIVIGIVVEIMTTGN